MPKRYFKYYLTAITVISFIACSEKYTLNGEGMLHLKVGVTDQVKVTTRSMTDELQDSLQRHCTIPICLNWLNLFFICFYWFLIS